jgi:hypothetical protein
MKNYTLEAASTVGAKELKNQKAAKAKRIVMASDVHLNSYQAARKIDNGAIVRHPDEIRKRAVCRTVPPYPLKVA